MAEPFVSNQLTFGKSTSGSGGVFTTYQMLKLDPPELSQPYTEHYTSATNGVKMALPGKQIAWGELTVTLTSGSATSAIAADITSGSTFWYQATFADNSKLTFEGFPVSWHREEVDIDSTEWAMDVIKIKPKGNITIS